MRGSFVFLLCRLFVTPTAVSPAGGAWHRRARALCCVGLLASPLPLLAQSVEDHGKVALGAIASAHPLATEAGFTVLAAGGNAFDAAVAVSAALAVVEPSSSGMGGGGFWLLSRASDGRETMIDGRERAPLAARRDMYLDADGKPRPRASLDGPLAAGIPGLPAALAHIAGKYGNLPLRQSLAPAIALARDGFEVDDHYLKMAGLRADTLAAWPSGREIFLLGGKAPTAGFRLVQPDLAATLERLADQGRAGFYGGRTAALLVAGVRAAGGIWQPQDLRDYRVVERQALHGTYAGARITTAPPPSSGGVALLAMLNILEPFDLPRLDDTTRRHLIIESMRRAYRDRAEYLGDPDFVDIPVSLLVDKAYAAGLRAGIRADRATSSADLPPVVQLRHGSDTTHLSILDRDGNAVAATLSINIPFGSGFVPPGTGVLLNDEMDDFSVKPGTPNAYGLVGAAANAVAPGKRPLSSMTPTIVRRGDQIAILGTPGGSRIITMVLLGALEYLGGNEDPADWVAVPRYHHQYLPDEVQFEKGGLSPAQQAALEALGHRLRELPRRYGNMQAVFHDLANHEWRAASDPRRQGLAAIR